ncbi:acyltransferase [Novosphingobium sp. CECT 9465]|uniref:acyltransferase family protein n=1 Tax=Novosphingobium sp. CECT 9465 TaxID=2829794 RepID=UPI001E2EA339|nr:acyltransferase [Novosphingobium sp. CECT 9465]CAH0495628.1 hypothetical protein NVSP9465_00635 [Novosphingobium sp. CECT 9465]
MVTFAQDRNGGGAVARYPVLDALRGLAALGVVFHHIPASSGLSAAGWDINFGRLVDLFFVISGFVITSAYGTRLAGGFSFLRFAWLRWGRIWPLHAVMLALFLIAMAGLGLARPDMRVNGILAGRQDIADLPAALLLLNGFVPITGMAWNHPSWSVSIEMVLYVLAALAWRWLGQGAVAAALIAAALALAMLLLDPEALGLAYDLARGIAGFGLGMALHAVFTALRPSANSSSALFTALEITALVALGAVLWGSGNIAAFDLAAVAFVGLGAIGKGMVSKLLETRPFQLLGTLSYALYMVHVFVIGRVFDLLGVVQGRLGMTIAETRFGGADTLVGPDWQADLAKLTIIAICLAAAWPAAVLIERPARAWSRRKAASFPSTPVSGN